MDRVGDVGDLGARRSVAGHHRGEHLGRGDDRLGLLAGESDQSFLRGWDLLDRQLDPEVPAGDHDPAAGRGDDLLRVLSGLRLLDLGDQRDVRVALLEPLVERIQIGGGANERDGEQVDVVVDREVEPAQVVGSGGRHPGVIARQVHSLVGGHPTAGLHLTSDRVVVDRERPQADPPVGEVDRVALANRSGEPIPADRQQLMRAERLDVGGQRQLSPGFDVREAAPQLVEAELRARQIAEHPDPLAEQLAGRADPLDRLGVLGFGAVGEVEPEDVGAGGDQPLEHLRRARRGPHRRDDLGPAMIGHQRSAV